LRVLDAPFILLGEAFSGVGAAARAGRAVALMRDAPAVR
jgi:hypothetical protein